MPAEQVHRHINYLLGLDVKGSMQEVGGKIKENDIGLMTESHERQDAD